MSGTVPAWITVSIVSHGHGGMIADLLDDLARQTIASEIAVVLTQNIPEPDPKPNRGSTLAFRIKSNPHPKGFGANHNAALADCRSPWVVILNPDIRLPDQGALEKLLKGSSHAAGIVAPTVHNSAGEREDSVRRNLSPLSLLRRRLGQDRMAQGPEAGSGFVWVAGMFMALPLEVWRALRGFDERFFLYCEDYDLCARAMLRGFPVVVDEGVTVVHDAQRTSHRSVRYLRLHLASLARVWTSLAFWRVSLSDVGFGRRS